MSDTGWMEMARCRGASTEVFFPPVSWDNDEFSADTYAAAKVYCGACPVRQDCLEHAVTHLEYGMWGGETERGRQRLRKALGIVRRRNARSKLVLLGGNHRFTAHSRLGRATIDAYVVECDDLTAVRITYEDNRNHGLTLTTDERIAHATHLVDLGWKLDPRGSSRRAVAHLHAQLRRGDEHVVGVDRPETPPPGAGQLGLNVQNFTKLERPPIDTGHRDRTVQHVARCTPDEIYALVTELNALGNAALAVDAIAVRRDKWAERIRTGIKVRAPMRAKLNDACFTVTTLPVDGIVQSCGTLDEKVALSRRCAETVVHLRRVIAKLGVKARTV